MKALLRFYGFIFLFCLSLLSETAAQSLKVLPVKLKPDEITPVPYIFVENQEALTKMKLAKQTYPIIIMQDTVFRKIYDISTQRTDWIAVLEKRKELSVKIEKISNEQIDSLTRLNAITRLQLRECDTLNMRLNRSLVTMNSNFESATKIVDKNLKKDMWHKAGIGLLGAGIGFTLATLLGAFK